MKIILLVAVLFLLGCAGENASTSMNAKMPVDGLQPGEPVQCRYEVDRNRCQTDGSLCVNECGVKIITLHCFEMSGQVVAWDIKQPNQLIQMPVEWCDTLNGLQNVNSTWYRTNNGGI